MTKIIKDWDRRAKIHSTYVICKTGRRPVRSLVGFYTAVLSRYFTKDPKLANYCPYWI